MNVSVRWLRELTPTLAAPTDEIVERLAMLGAPVDGVDRLGDGLGDVVVGRVVESGKHPNADRLSLCVVDAGGAEPVQVVCGAPNVRAGAFYAFAPVGATLPGGTQIRKAKIRGEVSQGMLCSAKELGLGRDHAGILELHGRFTPGESFVGATGLDDARLELDVTPNRPELLSHVGVARELAPGGDADLRLPPFAGTAAGADPLAVDLELDRGAEPRAVDGVRVSVGEPDLCPRYVGAVIRGVRVGPSPEWLASRLRAVGLRPINNVVDATNYVLMELGQPMHAFDLQRLTGPEIEVRLARAGESIVTLDGERRSLRPDMLVIADAKRPVALAGIMGGRDSEVTDASTDIFLECALFDPKRTRQTRRALGLSTDASFRYERGVDPEGVERAVRRAVALIRAVAGGEAASVAADLEPVAWHAPVVALRPSRCARVLGEPLSPRQIREYLEPLGFAVVSEDDDALAVRIPGFRSYDVTREADLIEEVARRHGYDRLPSRLGPFRVTTVPDDLMAGLENRLRQILVGRGFLEAVTAAFAPETHGDVTLANPLSAEESRLRSALLPGLLRRVEYNFARGARDIRLFEIGTAFAPGAGEGELPRETTRLAAAFTGSRAPAHWSGDPGAYDVWDLKALLRELADALGDGDLALEPGGEAPLLVDSASLTVRRTASESPVGQGGRVAPAAIDAPPWAEAVWALELRLVPEMARAEPPQFRPLPAHPAVERDLALLVGEEIPAAALESGVRAAAGELLEDVAVFDLYRGKGIPEGSRSLAFRLRFRSPERTLTDGEVDEAVAGVLRRLREEHGVERRG